MYSLSHNNFLCSLRHEWGRYVGSEIERRVTPTPMAENNEVSLEQV